MAAREGDLVRVRQEREERVRRRARERVVGAVDEARLLAQMRDRAVMSSGITMDRRAMTDAWCAQDASLMKKFVTHSGSDASTTSDAWT